MKKIVALCLCIVLVFSLGVFPTSAATNVHDEFESLVGFEIYKCEIAQPNGFASSVIKSEMMEDYAFGLDIEWWGEDAPAFAEAAKADFENFVNARYDVSAATWDAIRLETVGRYDEAKNEWISLPFFDVQKQVYLIQCPGGYGGGIPQSRYVGYVKDGNFYNVYLQLVNYVETQPTTGVEGKDWTKTELMGEVLYEVPLNKYHKYVVTYQNGILKKYKSTDETAVPANLVKAGESVTTTTTKVTTTTTTTIPATTTTTAATTTTTAAAVTTTTEAPITTTTTPEKPLVIVAKNETVTLESVADVFPENTVVAIEEIKETTKLETVKEAVKEIVKNFVAYDITATSNNITVQPNGKIKATFAVPANYRLVDVVVFYVSDDGKVEELPCTIDAQNGTVIAELSHFSTYIVAEKNAVVTIGPSETEPQLSYTWLWIVIAALIVVGGVAAWYFQVYRKKAEY